MKRIGILTFFHNSANYGGTLQAFALAKYLNSNNYSATQIRVNNTITSDKKNIVQIFQSYSLQEILNISKKRVNQKIQYYKANKYNINNLIQDRKNKFKEFNDKYVPSTNEVFTPYTIVNTENFFDIFVVGSDQVWSGGSNMDDVYLLNKVSAKKKKIAYAASRTEYFDDVQKKVFQKCLKNFDGISVREEFACKILQEITEQDVDVVVDPVFLLTKEEWEEIILSNVIHEKYIFCYFVGGIGRYSKIIEMYAKKNFFKIVYIPYVNPIYNKIEDSFGDIRLHDASQSEFLTLLRNAEIIFTDSFHGTAFSLIFEKEFYVLNRCDTETMSSRLVEITTISGTEDRYLKTLTKEIIMNIDKFLPINYQEVKEKLKPRIVFSKNFLKEKIG